jgi:hypothetical protein
MKKTAVKEVMNWILNNAVYHQTETLDGEINIHLLLDKKSMKKMFEKYLALEKEQLEKAFYDGDCNGNFETISKEEYYIENYDN